MIHRRLQKLGNILRELAMSGVIEPSQLGNTTNELDERQRDKVLQRRAVVGQIAQYVIPYVDALGYGKVVPVRGDEFREAVGCHEQRVLRVRAIEDVLTLGDEGGGGLEGEEAGLGFFAGDRVFDAVTEGFA